MSERYRTALIRYDAAATRLHRAETERRASEAHYLAWLWSAQELERARAAPKTLDAAITAAR